MFLIWLLVIDTPMFQILDICLDFAGAKNIHFLSVLILGFGEDKKNLTGVLHLNLNLDMGTGPQYTNDSKFGSLSKF